MSDHAKLTVIVHYPETDDQLKDHQASPTETVGALKTRVLAAFSLKEGVDDHGELIEFALYHHDKALRNLNKTTGDIAGDDKDLKLRLKRERHYFFYDGGKIFSPVEKATGLQIKEMIKAEHPAFDLTHDLIWEGEGHREDKVIPNEETLSLEVDKKHPAKHFFSKPPTNFG